MGREKMLGILLSNEEEREEKIHELIKEKESIDINTQACKNLTRGEKMADKLASFAGSWTFLIVFSLIVITYALINTKLILQKPFDPYPYVFLNLLLACIASIQAPIIMMSQSREAKKDRIRADNDYMINLKSEIILEDLHHKIDYLIDEQKRLKKELADININIQRKNTYIDSRRDDDAKKYTGREKH